MRALTDLLDHLEDSIKGDDVAISDLVREIGPQSFAALMLLFALVSSPPASAASPPCDAATDVCAALVDPRSDAVHAVYWRVIPTSGSIASAIIACVAAGFLTRDGLLVVISVPLLAMVPAVAWYFGFGGQ